ncbi:MAG TPA: hypothetical protein VM369_03110 [Candidatus Binatia bacterium]|nr:hypothetical protein [Candidatus Binatia bacterium]
MNKKMTAVLAAALLLSPLAQARAANLELAYVIALQGDQALHAIRGELAQVRALPTGGAVASRPGAMLRTSAPGRAPASGAGSAGAAARCAQ